LVTGATGGKLKFRLVATGSNLMDFQFSGHVHQFEFSADERLLFCLVQSSNCEGVNQLQIFDGSDINR
jgi:hypothetical protein